MISRFSKLKGKDEILYNKIVSLPFITSRDKFQGTLDEIENSSQVTENQLEYLKSKLKDKTLWAKCFLKTRFVGGVSTTSRVEGLHAKQKAYLTSNTGLQRLFHCFRLIEQIQVSNFKEEYQRHRNSGQIGNINSLNEIQEKFPEYIYKKMYSRYCKGLNYKLEKITTNSW